jgi:Co/Zn/Cd efflux system component
MGKDCCAPEVSQSSSQGWIRVLRIALVLNFLMFGIEIAASWKSGSMSLQADALDFLGDGFNYAISLMVAGSVVATRARVSLLKGATMTAFGLFILVQTVIKITAGVLPESPLMGVVGTLAFLTNLSCAVMLYRFRDGDSNMQSVWLCTRNDMIGNLMVIAAAGLVAWLSSGWPDWIASLILAGLGIQSGVKVIRLARGELRGDDPAPGGNAHLGHHHQ